MSGERPRAGEWRTEGHENSRAYNAWEGRGAQELSSVQHLEGDVQNSQIQVPLELSVLPLLHLVDTPHAPPHTPCAPCAPHAPRTPPCAPRTPPCAPCAPPHTPRTPPCAPRTPPC